MIKRILVRTRFFVVLSILVTFAGFSQAAPVPPPIIGEGGELFSGFIEGGAGPEERIFMIATAGDYTVDFTYVTTSTFPDPSVGDELFLELFQGTDTGNSPIMSQTGPGSFTFGADIGEYLISIAGTGFEGADFDMAIFAATVAPVPVPAALVLFGSAILMLWRMVSRRRVEKKIQVSGLPVAA